MPEFIVKSGLFSLTDVIIGDNFAPARSFPTLGAFINVLMQNILTIAGIVAFIGVVVTGWNVITHAGGGDSKAIEKDKQTFTAAVTGLIIIFGAYYIIQIVSTVVGFDFLNPIIP